MEAARTSETSVDNYITWQYIPEDKSELRTLRRENLKSRIQMFNAKLALPRLEIVLHDLINVFVFNVSCWMSLFMLLKGIFKQKLFMAAYSTYLQYHSYVGAVFQIRNL
jgi:hypothetical protein